MYSDMTTMSDLQELKAKLDQLMQENGHWIDKDTVDDSTESATIQDKEN